MSNILTNNINPRSGNLITIGGANDRVSIAGTLSYEDVANIDSVGIITAQAGIRVSAGSSIGIGIAEPTCKLQLSGNKMTADRAMIRLSDDQSGNGNFFVSSAGSGSANKLTIGENEDIFVSMTGDEAGGNTARRGYVGVGTDNPINNLHVNNNATGVGPIIQLTNDTGDCRLFFGQNSTVGSANAQGQFRYNVASNYMAMYTAGAEQMRITAAGLVGIGTDNPTDNLHILDSVSFAGLVIQSGRTSGTIGGLILQDSTGTNKANVYGMVDGELVFGTSGSEKMRIDSSGNVGINATNPSAKLQVNDGDIYIAARASSTETGIFFRNPADTATYAKIGYTNTTGNLVLGTTNTYPTVFISNDTERMQLDSDGRLLINTTTTGTHASNATLQVKSASSAWGINLRCRSENDFAYFAFSSNDSNESLANIFAQRTNTNEGYIAFETNSGNTSSTERMRITSTGGITWANSDAILESINSFSDARIRGSGTSVNIYIQSNGQTGVIQSGTGWISASSIRIKNVIDNVDSNQCWEFVKNISLKRYYYKDQPQEGTTYLGPIAEEISALDSEMSIMTNQEDSEGRIPSYNEPLMHMKALAALQTALVRIETLEQRLTDAGL